VQTFSETAKNGFNGFISSSIYSILEESEKKIDTSFHLQTEMIRIIISVIYWIGNECDERKIGV
jgi:hypothetical protein